MMGCVGRLAPQPPPGPLPDMWESNQGCSGLEVRSWEKWGLVPAWPTDSRKPLINVHHLFIFPTGRWESRLSF